MYFSFVVAALALLHAEPSLAVKNICKQSQAFATPEVGQVINGYALRRVLYHDAGHAEKQHIRVFLAEKDLEYYAIKAIDNVLLEAHPELKLEAYKQGLAAEGNPHVLGIVEEITTPTAYFIVMPYAAGGSLWDLIQKSPGKRGLHEEEAKEYFRMMLSAVDGIHKKKIFHEDIKPENFMLTDKRKILLIDFGTAKTLAETGTQQYYQELLGDAFSDDPVKAVLPAAQFPWPDGRKPAVLVNGSLCYISQADIMAKTYNAMKKDVFALGATLYDMVQGTPEVPQFRNDFKLSDDRHLSSNLQDLINKMTAPASERIVTSAIWDEPWLAAVSPSREAGKSLHPPAALRSRPGEAKPLTGSSQAGASNPPPSRQVRVQVKQHMRGKTVMVKTPEGLQLRVQIPKNAMPGSVLLVGY